MDITDIEVYRDGGTIEFCLSAHPLAGLFRLPPRWSDRPPNLLRDGKELAAASAEERQVLELLREWMLRTLTPDLAKSLSDLDSLREWRNLPPTLASAVPVHYIRTVIDYLSGRSSPEPR